MKRLQKQQKCVTFARKRLPVLWKQSEREGFTETGGDQKSFVCTLWVKWSLFSVKKFMHAQLLHSRVWLVLRGASCTSQRVVFFLFFSFAFWCREDLFVERRSTKEGDGSFPGDPQQHHHAAVSLWILWAVTQTSPRPSSLCYNSPEMFPLSSFYAKSSRSAATDWCEWQQNVGVRSPPNPLLLVSGLGPGRHGWRWISVWPVRLKMFSTPSPPR